MEKFPHLFLPDHMTTTVPFPGPDHCTCAPAEGTWQLEVDGGGMGLTHDGCGKPLLHDLLETVTSGGTITVTLTPEVDDCHCLSTCDCAVWLTMKGTK